MYDWLLHNALFVLLVLCAAVITVGLIVTALTKVRAEFSRLREEIKELSEQVKALETAEQGRFLKEIKSHRQGSEPLLSTNVRLRKSEMEPEAASPLVP
jgi:uncharacterized membrane protein (DUF106 family)